MSRDHRMMLQQPHTLLLLQPHKTRGVWVAVGVTGRCCISRTGCCGTQAHTKLASGLSRGHRVLLQQPHRLLRHQPHNKLGVGVTVGF